MQNKAAYDVPSWYAIQTKPGEEDRANLNLRAWNIETFTPKIKSRRYNQLGGKPTFVTKHLFPRYIFARFVVNRLIQSVNYTRGVQKVVSFGSPTPVDDQIIDIIRARIGEDGFVHVGDSLKSGDEVLIKDGPMKGFVGLFERPTSDAMRVSVLMSTISFQPRIIIDRDLIQKYVH